MDKVVHFEIPAANVSRAQKFYRTVFGWKTLPLPDMDYTMVYTVETDRNRMPKESGAINGGMMKRVPAIKSPVITIDVANVEDAIKKVTRSGGKLVRGKQEVMNMGWTAYVKDSEGNVIGLWQTKKKR